MCWNAEVSLQTFIVSSMGLATLYYLDYDNIIITLIFSFVFMQLIEFFMWIYIKKPKISRYFGVLSLILVLLQPIILLYFTQYSVYIWLYVLLQFIICIICVFFFGLTWASFDFVPKVAKNGHLRWNWFHNKYLFAFSALIYFVFFIGTLYLTHTPAFIIALGTLLFSSYNYGMYGTFSSMWCWIANICIIFALIHALILLKPFIITDINLSI